MDIAADKKAAKAKIARLREQYHDLLKEVSDQFMKAVVL